MFPPPYTPVCIFICLPVVKALRQSCGHRRRIPAHLGRFAMNIALILVLAVLAIFRITVILVVIHFQIPPVYYQLQE